MRWGWLALALWAGACAQSKPAPRGLRVPLPEGWVASAATEGVLGVGPKGRVVLTLERKAGALPALAALTAAVEAEGAVVERTAATPDSMLVRYARASEPGVLQLRTLEGGALLLCATTADASAAEFDAAEALCGGVGLERGR